MNCHACDHRDTHYVRQELRNGTFQVFRQCKLCGYKTTSALSHAQVLSEIRKPSITALPELDKELENAGYEAWRSDLEKFGTTQREEMRVARFDEMSRYYATPEWRAKADMRLSIDRGRCTARLVGCTVEATQVHHKTYDHFGNEPMFDLVSVCKFCHDKITEMDRASR